MVTCRREETAEPKREQCPEQLWREAILVQIVNLGVLLALYARFCNPGTSK